MGDDMSMVGLVLGGYIMGFLTFFVFWCGLEVWKRWSDDADSD